MCAHTYIFVTVLRTYLFMYLSIQTTFLYTLFVVVAVILSLSIILFARVKTFIAICIIIIAIEQQTRNWKMLRGSNNIDLFSINLVSCVSVCVPLIY